MSDIKLITLSNYIRPPVKVNVTKKWVLNGVKNSFYDYINDRLKGSPTNASIIHSYAELVYGRGLDFSNRGSVQDWAKLQTILRPKELRKIILDYVVYNEFSFQVIKNKGKGLHSIEHLAKQSVVPNVENDEMEIESYWFSKDWHNEFQNVPEEFSAFGTSKDAIEIYRGMPYTIDGSYFPDPQYMAGMPYMEMEEENANGNVSYIKNGLTAGYIINIPDGVNLTDELKDKLERKIKKTLTGSNNAGAFILNFAARDQEPITVEVFPVAENIHKQWQWLSNEASQKILTSHRATSPSLVGIISSSGFSNTADEMDMAESQLMKRVIKPKQDFILEAIEEVLLAYGISLDLFFKPLTEVTQEPTQLHKHVCLSDEENLKMFDVLDTYALDMSEDYDLTDGTEYDLKLSANQTSEQDSKLWKIRYAYVKGTNRVAKGSTRAFCNRMLLLEATGKVFRKEDIELMGMQGVNGQFAHSGGKYDIFLYAGGVNCHHRWERRIFKKKLNADGTPKKGGAMQQTTEVNVNDARRQGANIPKNDPDVAIAEIDKPRKGKF